MARIRYTILFWLRNKARIPEGAVFPFWLRALYLIFFPLEEWTCRYAGIRYDARRGFYIFHGVKVTRSFFDELGRMKDGTREYFFLTKKGDEITICNLPSRK